MHVDRIFIIFPFSLNRAMCTDRLISWPLTRNMPARARSSGRGMRIRLSNLRRIALSRLYGILVAASTSTYARANAYLHTADM